MAPVDTFVPRESLLNRVRGQLLREPDVDHGRHPKKVGIWGLGGTGKSQLALSYVQRYGDEYDSSFWIDAQDPVSVDKCFLDIYRSLREPMPVENLTAAGQIRHAVRQWFQGREGTWLMVFDGADELDRGDQNFVHLSSYIPGCPTVHVIVTTRSRQIESFSPFGGVEVGKLDPEEAAELFSRCARLSPQARADQANAVAQIAEELDYLALAVNIAGCYVSHMPRLSNDLCRYLNEHRLQKHGLLVKQPDILTDQYPHSVMTVWEASYSAVQNRFPGACQFLSLLAFLDSQDIFVDLFVPQLGVDVPAVPSRGSWTHAIGLQNHVEPCDIEKLFSVLEWYSMLHRSEGGCSYSMHKLVRTWCRDRLGGTPDVKRFALAALQLLCDVTNTLRPWGSNPKAELRLSAHIRENTLAIGRLQLGPDEEELDVLDKLEHLGNFLSNSGSSKEASSILCLTLEWKQRRLGDKHPRVITVMHSLGVAFALDAKYDEATEVLTTGIEKSRRVLGPSQSLTSEMRESLEAVRRHQREWETLWEKVTKLVAALESQIAISIQIIDKTRRMKAQNQCALERLRPEMDDFKRILGNNHPAAKADRDALALGLKIDADCAELLGLKEAMVEDLRACLDAALMYPGRRVADAGLKKIVADVKEVEQRTGKAWAGDARVSELLHRMLSGGKVMNELLGEVNVVRQRNAEAGYGDYLLRVLRNFFGN